jgi:hypothetical protein
MESTPERPPGELSQISLDLAKVLVQEITELQKKLEASEERARSGEEKLSLTEQALTKTQVRWWEGFLSRIILTEVVERPFIQWREEIILMCLRKNIRYSNCSVLIWKNPTES